jgi:hypothetical protein
VLEEPYKFWSVAKKCRILCFTATSSAVAHEKETAIFNKIDLKTYSYGNATKQVRPDEEIEQDSLIHRLRSALPDGPVILYSKEDELVKEVCK